MPLTVTVLMLNQIHPRPLLHVCLYVALCILKDLQVNSKLEVSADTDGVKRWHDGTVEEIKYEDGKRLLKVRPLAQQITYGDTHMA